MSSLPPSHDFRQARIYLKDVMISCISGDSVGVRLNDKMDDFIEALYMAFVDRYESEQKAKMKAVMEAQAASYERYLQQMESMGFTRYIPPTVKGGGR